MKIPSHLLAATAALALIGSTAFAAGSGFVQLAQTTEQLEEELEEKIERARKALEEEAAPADESSDPETQTQEPSAEPEPAAPESGPKAEQEPEPAAEPEAEAESEVQSESEVTPEPEPEAEAEPQPEMEPETAPAPPQPDAQPTEELPDEAPVTEEAQPEDAPAEETDASPMDEPSAAPDEQAPPAGEAPPPDESMEGEDAGAAEPGSDDAAGEERLAPILDSNKEPAATEEEGRRGERRDRRDDEARGDRRDREPSSDQPAEPAPASDAEAQPEVDREEIEALRREEGRRIEEPRWRRGEDRDDDPGEVVREIGDRLIYMLGGEMRVERRDRDERVRRGARDVYYEELRNGRVREVVERRDGTRVVTIRDRRGDILHRSKIYPDGREVVLLHVGRDHYERMRDRRPAGWDLPPMRLTIPVEEYIFEAERARSRDDYYEFLRQPPVERVERTYAISEVIESPRIRDKARRIDLDTINFDFNSAVISQAEIEKLDDVAWAIQRLLEDNPGEILLVEGHTDAVGSDVYNLALSDERAFAVIDALTEYYDIPPENLVAQGYGERFLKVDTQDRSRENRRVAIRRITPLVAPVASNQ